LHPLGDQKVKSGMFAQAGVTGENLVQIAADVQDVEALLKEFVGSPVEVVQKSLRHTLDAGGKRLRPAFLVLSARATGHTFDRRRALTLGACMEMVHMATLIHDDVIDEAATRRGRPTASHLFGNTASILTGDVLLARAMQLLAEDGDIEIIRLSSKMVVEMAEGEAREVEIRGNLKLSLEEHLHVLRMKTAAFVECCCQIGGMVAGVDRVTVDALGRYGHHLGIAFQLVDDLLDYRGQVEATGKPKATDFREGCATMPLLEVLPKLSRTELQIVESSFGTDCSDEVISEICKMLEAHGGYAAADKLAEEHLEQALEALRVLPQNSHRDLLEAAGRFVIQRKT